jgi:DNA-binding MarR family transcriptional regulator
MSARREPITWEVGATVQRHQAAVADFDREVARLLHVNGTDLRCLEILLGELPEAAPGVLATRLGLTTGSVTTMLDRLAAQGYVTRSPHPTDRRKTVVRATPEIAERARGLIEPLVDDGNRTLLPRYTIAQLEVVIDFLRRDIDLQDRHTQRLRDLPTPDQPTS